jgi:hypothetical protein
MQFWVFLFMAQQTLAGQGLFIVEDSRSHSDIPHSIEMLWTSDIPMPSAGFEPASERAQTHSLDHAVIGIGYEMLQKPLIIRRNCFGL